MDSTRIAGLLRPYFTPNDSVPQVHVPLLDVNVGLHQLQSISTYINLLLRWNARVNLTAVRDPEEIVTRHFGESLFAARYLFPDRVGPGLSPGHAERGSAVEHQVSGDRPYSARGLTDLGSGARTGAQPSTGFSNGGLQSGAFPDVLDFGSGAGFPGIPIKLWAPLLRVTLIESNQKKATFLREVIRALTLTDIDVFSARAGQFQGQAAVVALRAVERFEQALPTAATLVAPQGRLALLIVSSQSPQAQQLAPSFTWQDPVPVPGSESRILLIGSRP